MSGDHVRQLDQYHVMLQRSGSHADIGMLHVVQPLLLKRLQACNSKRLLSTHSNLCQSWLHQICSGHTASNHVQHIDSARVLLLRPTSFLGRLSEEAIRLTRSGWSGSAPDPTPWLGEYGWSSSSAFAVSSVLAAGSILVAACALAEAMNSSKPLKRLSRASGSLASLLA